MKKQIVLTVFVILAIIGAYLWQTNKPENIVVQDRPVKIGIITPLSGFLADYGEETRRGVLAAPHDGIEYVFEDEKCESAPALSAFKKLTEFDQVQFIIGPGCGAPQETIAPQLKGKDILVLVPSAATQELYSRSGGNLYNIQYALEDESAFIAKRMYELGYKRVALIHYANAFSDVHTATFKKHFRGEIVIDSIILKDDTDVSTELLKIRSAKPDAIFSTDVSFFFAQGLSKARNLGIKMPIFSQYAVELPAVRSMVEGVIYSFPKDITDGEGAVYGLAKQSAELLIPLVKSCKGDYRCVKNKIDLSGEFNDLGIKKRDLVLKQIVNGKPSIFNQ